MISLCMLVRDDASTLRACLESIRPHVDEICVLDTGSSDDSPAIAKEFADKWAQYSGCNLPDGRIRDFADARNKSFAMASHEWRFWLDADDVIEGAEKLREMAAQAPPGQVAYLIPYEYSYDEAGRPTCVHWRERLMRGAFHWTTPCHEVCLPDAGPPQTMQSSGVTIKHRAQQSTKAREPERNLRILQDYRRTAGEGDVRARYYLGVEYGRHGYVGPAQETLRRYVELSGWADEKCLALLELARINYEIGDCATAIDWALRASTVKSWPDPYFLIARACFRLADRGFEAEHNIRRALHFAKQGRALPDASTVLFYNPTERFAVERLCHRGYAALGGTDEAAESCRRGLAGMPGDPELMQALLGYEGQRILGEVRTGVARLVTCGVIQESGARLIEGVLDGTVTVEAPVGVSAAPAIDESTLPPVPGGKLDLVFWVGHQYEPWNPDTLKAGGMGGSETMAWEMSRRLAGMGHRVRVYGHCTPGQEGVFDGVFWCDASRFARVSCDVLIVSRQAEAIDLPCEAKARVLWLHDVHCGEALLDPARALRFDEVWCLSEWHARYVASVYPRLDPRRIVVTRNGVDVEEFA